MLYRARLSLVAAIRFPHPSHQFVLGLPCRHDSATPWLQERLLNLENLSYLTARDVLFLFNFFTVTVWFFFSISFLPFFEKRKLWNAQRTKGGRPVRVASLWTCLCGCARVKLNSLGYCCTVKLRPEPVIMACASMHSGRLNWAPDNPSYFYESYVQKVESFNVVVPNYGFLKS